MMKDFERFIMCEGPGATGPLPSQEELRKYLELHTLSSIRHYEPKKQMSLLKVKIFNLRKIKRQKFEGRSMGQDLTPKGPNNPARKRSASDDNNTPYHNYINEVFTNMVEDGNNLKPEGGVRPTGNLSSVVRYKPEKSSHRWPRDESQQVEQDFIEYMTPGEGAKGSLPSHKDLRAYLEGKSLNSLLSYEPKKQLNLLKSKIFNLRKLKRMKEMEIANSHSNNLNDISNHQAIAGSSGVNNSSNNITSQVMDVDPRVHKVEGDSGDPVNEVNNILLKLTNEQPKQEVPRHRWPLDEIALLERDFARYMIVTGHRGILPNLDELREYCKRKTLQSMQNTPFERQVHLLRNKIFHLRKLKRDEHAAVAAAVRKYEAVEVCEAQYNSEGGDSGASRSSGMGSDGYNINQPYTPPDVHFNNYDHRQNQERPRNMVSHVVEKPNLPKSTHSVRHQWPPQESEKIERDFFEYMSEGIGDRGSLPSYGELRNYLENNSLASIVMYEPKKQLSLLKVKIFNMRKLKREKAIRMAEPKKEVFKLKLNF